MSGGRPKAVLDLSAEEREALEAIAKRPTSTQRMALRCRIVLMCAEGVSNTEVARELGVTATTVGKWRERYRTDRLKGLEDEERSGAPKRITDDKIREVIAKTMGPPPPGAQRWSTRLMAEEAGISQTAVLRIWRSCGLRPDRRQP